MEEVKVILDLESCEINYQYTVRWSAIVIARGAEHTNHFDTIEEAVAFSKNVLIDSDYVLIEERKIYTVKDNYYGPDAT